MMKRTQNLSASPAFKPRKLTRNKSKILLFAPAFHFQEEKYLKGKTFIEQTLDVQTLPAAHLRQNTSFFSASDEDRLQDIITGLLDPKVDALLGVRGGYGCCRIYMDLRSELKKIIASLSRRKKTLPPKIVAGYSDLTLLINGLYQDFNWVTFHTPMISGRPFETPLPYELKSFESCLFSTQPLGEIPKKMGGISMETLHEGQTKAILVGGNLSVIASSLGTPYELKTDDRILFLEDLGEAPFRVERMLFQLLHAGLFDAVKGVILGDFSGCKPHSEHYANVSVQDVMQDFFKRVFHKRRVPVITGFPCGHGTRQISFPIGTFVSISARKKNCSVKFMEAGVQTKSL